MVRIGFLVDLDFNFLFELNFFFQILRFIFRDFIFEFLKSINCGKKNSMEKDALLIVYIQFYIKDFISALFLEW